MIGFLTSVSWIGWALIALVAFTLLSLPMILREGIRGVAGTAERRKQPGENPAIMGTNATDIPSGDDTGAP
ncbi:MAG: hypothetical protein AAF727_17545 [Pseudomonadota bacterium]